MDEFVGAARGGPSGMKPRRQRCLTTAQRRSMISTRKAAAEPPDNLRVREPIRKCASQSNSLKDLWALGVAGLAQLCYKVSAAQIRPPLWPHQPAGPDFFRQTNNAVRSI